MRRIGILCLVTGALMLGGCSLGGQERGDTVAGSDIIIEKHTEEDIEEGPTAPSLSPEEATIEPLQLPELGTETNTVNPVRRSDAERRAGQPGGAGTAA